MNKHILLMSCALSVLAVSGGGAYAAAAAATSTASSTSGGTTISEVVVTAERRSENLQDTPIAVSAFSSASLQNKKLDGGQNLILQIPNANYTRSNFGGYNFKIRGIGTDVITFGGTSGVSINENELPVSDNNFANTDFYDMERVEVLRGPQGTLYGRNATGGAVDLITNKPTDTFGGYATIGYGNYDGLKITGAVNIPLGEALSLRIAGFRYTQDGFGENSYLNKSVDGRDLGSIRGTLRFHPNDRFDAYLMYEHYGENDDRNRLQKQLCISDPGPTSVGGVSTGGDVGANGMAGYRAFLSQGCLPGSLYQASAYGLVNSNATLGGVIGNLFGINNGTNVYGANPLQNTNLHNIQAAIQPLFTSEEDLFDLHVAYKLTDNLTLTSITGFNRSSGDSAEDYNRAIASTPMQPVGFAALLFPNGVIPDPQVGTTNLFRTFDFGTAEAKEYTEELRLTSSFSGPLNFSVGALYAERTTIPGSSNYIVESNSLTGASIFNNTLGGYGLGYPLGGPIYIDPSYPPQGVGHNYYDARNGGDYLKSYAGFGEVYYNITPQLKLTLGGRYTVDQLYNVQYPIELFVVGNNGSTPINGAYGGFPNTVCSTSSVTCLIPQAVTYREFTGRANIDWTPTVSFTDKTLFYATYSRGYKGGGFNTPCQASLGGGGGSAAACGYPLSYNPEFIDAYELGTKNTLLGGKLTLDGDFFYYNYTGYQISTIVSESSVNLNVNAKIYGVEFEGAWSPINNLTLNANVGYLHTAIDNGQSFVDQMNLTQGNPNYTLVKTTGGANCLALTSDVAYWMAAGLPPAGLSTLCGPVNPLHPNGGGIPAQYAHGVPIDLGGNHLPNSPPWTLSLGAQYTVDLPHDWSATLRGDFYWQDDSYARVWNAVNDLLQSYHNVNATLTFNNAIQGLSLQFWVKNMFNAQPITGVYLTDATSGLFQNVFTLDPRTFGVQLTKKW
jgi:outer membrane receptor protein involved in Fe transport